MHALKTTTSNRDSVAKLAVLKDEGIAHALLFIILLIIFRIVFYKDAMSTVLSFVASTYWLFILPGSVLMLYWSRRFGFAERAAVGTAVALSIIGTVSYYIAIAGLHVKYHYILFPPVLIAIGIAAFWMRCPEKEDKKEPKEIKKKKKEK